jgi:hypothetical protein
MTELSLSGLPWVRAAHAQEPSGAKPFPERHPDPPQVIRMLNFAGGFNLPIWMTERQGYFAAEKINVKVDFISGSAYHVTNPMAGTYGMGFIAIDNINCLSRRSERTARNQHLIAVRASDDGFLSISPLKGHHLD